MYVASRKLFCLAPDSRLDLEWAWTGSILFPKHSRGILVLSVCIGGIVVTGSLVLFGERFGGCCG